MVPRNSSAGTRPPAVCAADGVQEAVEARPGRDIGRDIWIRCRTLLAFANPRLGRSSRKLGVLRMQRHRT